MVEPILAEFGGGLECGGGGEGDGHGRGTHMKQVLHLAVLARSLLGGELAVSSVHFIGLNVFGTLPCEGLYHCMHCECCELTCFGVEAFM